MVRWRIQLVTLVVMVRLVPIVAYGAGETNLVISGKSDERSSWESIFVEENQIPFHINLYRHKGFYYELENTDELKGPIASAIFSKQTRLTGSLGGNLQVDVAAYQQDGDLPPVDNGIDIRRFRINSYGRSYFLTPLSYGVEFGYTAGTFYFNDGYLWFHDVPYVGSIKAGFFKAPMSLEALESSSSTTLMEVPAPVSAFAPSYKFGMQLGDAVFAQRGTIYGGWYADAEDPDSGDASSSYNRLIGRATWLPVDNTLSSRPQLVHLGISLGHMFAAGGMQFRSRPESYLAPYLVDTGEINGDRAFVFGVESAWRKGPLSVQAEYMHTTGDNEEGYVFNFGGFYLSGSWVLTGESRAYGRDVGVFKGIVPRDNMSLRNRTWGAWEWGTRYSHVDLTDAGISGGVMSVVSTGLNCYLTERNRLMFNVGYSEVSDSMADGDLLFVQSRLQILF